MNNGFLMSVLNPLADAHEKIQPFADGEFLTVAIIGDGDARDVLHHKIGATIRSGTSVENFGNGGMIHHRQRLPFPFKALHRSGIVSAWAKQLDSNLATNRRFLFGEPDLAHTTLS